MKRLVKSTGRDSPALIMSTIFLWAASRPVSNLPDSSTVSPGFQDWISALVTVARLTRRTLSPVSQLISGQCSRLGGSRRAGPLPSSTKWVWRAAAELGAMAPGLWGGGVGEALNLPVRPRVGAAGP